MKLGVSLFATLKERARAAHLELDLMDGDPTVKDLLAEVVAQRPSLEPSMRSVLVAVNREFAFPEQVLQPGDEIALFPPVSGG